MRLRPVRGAMLACTLLVATACGATAPSVDDARTVLHQRLDNGNGTRLRLTHFQKTDGRRMEVMGVKAYELMFTATAEFAQDALFAIAGPSTVFGTSLDGRANAIRTAEHRERSGNILQDFSLSFNNMQPARRGDILRLSGRVAFEQRESGWVATATSFTVVHVNGDDLPEQAEKRRKQAAYLKELEDLVTKEGTDLHGNGQATIKGYIDNGGDPNVRVKYGSLLSIAAQSGYRDLVELLLSTGADINGGQDDGTPLYWAIVKGEPSIALFLMEKGADINKAKSGGWTPLDVAESPQSELDPQDPLAKELISMLKLKGARKRS